MSDYVSKKAIRYRIKKKLTEEEREELWDYKWKDNKSLKQDFKLEHDMEFDSSYSEDYLDIILRETYGTISGDFGSSRKLTDKEAEEYLSDFKRMISDVTKEDLRYVFYCYYNGTDAPDCFDEGDWNNE